MNSEPTNEPRFSVGFVSLGCAKNMVDTQLMAGNLIAESIALVPAEEADVVIINTCSFVKDARDESHDEILYACQQKAEGFCSAVAVTGCLPQRYREELLKEYPEVDAFLGLDELDDIAGVVERLMDGATGIISVSEKAKKLYEPMVPGLAFSQGAYAYLKIAEGCNHHCAYCAIPSIRGDYRSRTVDSVVSEAESILEQGYGELTLISQDSSAFGKDLKDGSNLPELLKAIDGIGGQFWVRVLYVYPSLITDELLGTMASIDRVCNYLDMPIQHSHPDVLKAMNRAPTVPYIEALPERIRSFMPDAALRTTCIVGFPGETDEQFEHLYNHILQAKYDHLGVFTYSPEENTPAFDMAGRPADQIAIERRDRIMAAQQEIVEAKAAALIGNRTEVLLEQPMDESGRRWVGRSQRFAPEVDGVVYVKTKKGRGRGDFVPAKYTVADGYDMRATE